MDPEIQGLPMYFYRSVSTVLLLPTPQSHSSIAATVGNGVSLGLPGCLMDMGPLSPAGSPSRKLPPERAAGDATAEDGLAR